jgi:hypothetical protein
MKSRTFGLFGEGGRKKLDAHCVTLLKNTGYNPRNFSRPYQLMSEINHPDIMSNIPQWATHIVLLTTAPINEPNFIYSIIKLSFAFKTPTLCTEFLLLN